MMMTMTMMLQGATSRKRINNCCVAVNEGNCKTHRSQNQNHNTKTKKIT